MKRVMLASLCLLMLACGDSTSSSPTAPSPPTPPAPTYTLSGRVTANPFTPVPGATLTISGGTNNGKSATADPAGGYKIEGLAAGTFTLTVSAASYQTRQISVTVSGDQTLDIELQRSPST